MRFPCFGIFDRFRYTAISPIDIGNQAVSSIHQPVVPHGDGCFVMNTVQLRGYDNFIIIVSVIVFICIQWVGQSRQNQSGVDLQIGMVPL